MYNVVLCDDNKEYIKYLNYVLKEIKEELNIELCVYEYNSGEELVRNLDSGINYDLLILDMQLGGIDGNETARLFREKYPYTVLVFCSGFLKPTVESFKATPFRYIIKDQTHQELLETMKEILNEVERNLEDQFIIGHYRSAVRRINLKNILYIETSKRGSRIVLHPKCKEAKLKEKLLLDKKPEDLFIELKEFGFALARSTYLVNMSHIDLLQSEDFVFDNGEIFKISRAYQKSFKEAFINFSQFKYL